MIFIFDCLRNDKKPIIELNKAKKVKEPRWFNCFLTTDISSIVLLFKYLGNYTRAGQGSVYETEVFEK